MVVIEVPSDIANANIELEQLESELRTHFPGVSGLSLQTIEGKHVKLYLHGDLGEASEDAIMRVIRSHSPRATMMVDAMGMGEKTLEERVAAIEAFLFGKQ